MSKKDPEVIARPAEEEHWVEQVYQALVLRGIDPHDIVPNFEMDDSHVVCAVPKAKVAIATDGDTFQSLLEDDWNVSFMALGALRAFAQTARALSAVAVEYRVRGSAQEMLKMGSTQEQLLLSAILRANLPEPTRNFKVKDEAGKTLTIPDFAWPEYRVAFFVDGLWWHHGRDSDIQAQVATGAADKAVVAEAHRGQVARATKDNRSRSAMSLDGWIVLACTDEDLPDLDAAAAQVQAIKRALADRARQGKLAT